MKRSRRILTVGVMAVLFVGISAASTVTYTASTPQQTTDFSAALTLPQFDPTLGTLTSVEITLKGTENVAALTVTNNADIEEDDFTINATSQISGITNTAVPADNISAFSITLFSTGLITLGPVGDPVCPANTPGPTCNSVNFSPPGFLTGSGSVTDSSAAIVAYIGLGTFDITGVTKAFTTFSGGGGNINLFQNTTAALEADVTYTFTGLKNGGTPEPATLFLMGSALVGVGLLRRRSMKS